MSASSLSAYEKLVQRSREVGLLSSCAAVLGWDEQTFLPPGGVELRGRQLALLAGLAHEKATDPAIGDWLAEVEASALVDNPDSIEAVNVREWRRQYDRRTKLPRALVEAIAQATSEGQLAWAEAPTASDFGRFRHHLATIVGLKRQEAACLGGPGPAYDALLDEYEPGIRSADLAALFRTVREAVAPLVQRILEAPRQPDRSLVRGEYPIDRQKVLGEIVASALGFDFHRGRLDTSPHPFCTGIGPGDTRMTTRFDPHDFSDGFFSILHETGHGLYEQGLDPTHHGTPMGEAVSLGVHESQSRLWENAVGRSESFWRFGLPLVRRIFPGALRGVPIDAFVFAINEVRPSLIRVQADEATYNLHILIRHELEQALIAGDLSVEEVPAAWNAAYERDLGIRPKTDAEGCLQDIHWSAGLFGYFPTYTLGNVYAAQLFATARAELGDLDAAFGRGEFAALREWLRDRVHRHGQRHRASDLIQKVTGQPPTPSILVESLREKSSALYGIAAG